MPNQGGRYVMRNGERVLVERSGHKRAPVQPAAKAAKQPVEESPNEDSQETAASSTGE
ncbi:hypothetical protein SAMN04487958_107202 [Vreelandella subterranea]|uniref:Uncharacterized protein n=1 Tax=Vreelandella subterranea TaxID=416874 RepID=A0A1H9UT19_9GAMM|nr:hypothetical protein [Halomonas subterranea]SES12552.1 hypothetical protein SAMN04487958_107202 [Halomonas subterranea]